MVDGPLKNMDLGKDWDRPIEALENDAVDLDQCKVFVSDSITRELNAKPNISVLNKIKLYQQQSQLDIDPTYHIRKIFGENSKPPFIDQLEKQLIRRLGDGMQIEDALPQSLEATIIWRADEVKNRLQEKVIHSHEMQEIDQEKSQNLIEKISRTLDGLDVQLIGEAVLKGDKNAFKDAINKKSGIDEGPKL